MRAVWTLWEGLKRPGQRGGTLPSRRSKRMRATRLTPLHSARNGRKRSSRLRAGPAASRCCRLLQDLGLQLAERALQLLAARRSGASARRGGLGETSGGRVCLRVAPWRARCDAPVGLEQQVAVDEPGGEEDADQLKHGRHERQPLDPLRRCQRGVRSSASASSAGSARRRDPHAP